MNKKVLYDVVDALNGRSSLAPHILSSLADEQEKPQERERKKFQAVLEKWKAPLHSAFWLYYKFGFC